MSDFIGPSAPAAAAVKKLLMWVSAATRPTNSSTTAVMALSPFPATGSRRRILHSLAIRSQMQRLPPAFNIGQVLATNWSATATALPGYPKTIPAGLGVIKGARTRLAPVEKLQAERSTAVDRRARERLDQRQRIFRKPVHLVPFFKPLYGFGPAANAPGMAGGQEAAVSVDEAVIGAHPAVAARALIHIGPHQFFEQSSVNAHKALSAMRTGQHSS